MKDTLIRQFIREALVDQSFIRHMRNGLDMARGSSLGEASSIVDDWLEEVELRMGNLLAPGHVSRLTRFVANEWPQLLERYRGNKMMALIAMNNLLDAKLDAIRMGD